MRAAESARRSLSISSGESLTPLRRTDWQLTGMPASTKSAAARLASGVTSSAQLNCVLTQTFLDWPRALARRFVMRDGLVQAARVQTRTRSI